MKIYELYIKLFMFAFFSFANGDVEINTSSWDENPVAGGVEPIIFDKIMSAKTKYTTTVENLNKPLQVNIYNIFYRKWKEMVGPKDKVRCTEIIFSWVPLGTKLGGLVTMLLVDKRQEKSSRIKGQVSFKPDRPTVAIFYQNYFVPISEIKYLDFEIMVNGINFQHGSFGEVSLYWKTYVGKANIYKERDPIVFYIDVEELPETEVNDSQALFKRFAQKAKNRREKELNYFKEIQNFIDINRKPINFASADLAELSDTLNRKKEMAIKYIKNLELNQPKNDKLNDLKNDIILLQDRESMLEENLNEKVLNNAANTKEVELYNALKNKPVPEVNFNKKVEIIF
ncbi:putative movement protein [Emaravirus verbanni]|uniref:Putative movement protein n=1 Tax=Emaravirus verbanni TaxID=2843908 RepID=A0A6B9EMH5_9VIRU|nr:putative movement protein [Emaravirus verbanni]QGX73510.1 putative movement protein [Emaravirus verbanni]